MSTAAHAQRELRRLVDQDFRAVQKAALRPGCALRAQLLSLRRSVLSSPLAELTHPSVLAQTRGTLERHRAATERALGPHALEASDLVSLRGTPTSQLQPAAAFACQLPGPATSVLCQLAGEALAEGMLGPLFARSRLACPETRYRTEFDAAGPYVVGFDGSHGLHLAGIAHELGHCAVERRRLATSFGELVLSEGCAQWFEELVVDAWLEQSGLPEAQKLRQNWRRYQRKVDLLNLHLFAALEAELAGRTDFPALFEQRFLLLRPAFLVMPGYEAVFAIATLLRLELQRSLPWDVQRALPMLSGEPNSALRALSRHIVDLEHEGDSP